MRALRYLVPLAAAALLGAIPARAADEAFSFYGLQFGMTRDEVDRRFGLDGSAVRKPGHGMSGLEVAFDREDLLMEIRASWPRPEDPLAYQGLLRALRERFVATVGAKFPTVAVTIDEYSNRAAVQLDFLATDIREKNIDYHKARFLETLK